MEAIGAQLAQLAREIWAWQSETFGDGCTVHGAVAKIRDECAEVLAAQAEIEHRRHQSWGSQLMFRAIIAPYVTARREELADVFFMLVQMTGAAGSSHIDPTRSHILKHCIGTPLAYSLGRVDAASHAFLEGMTWGRVDTQAQHSAVAAWLDACSANNDLPHMPAAIRKKLAVNKARTWAKPAEDGTISHVKGHDNE